jgi:hypothetical protein
MRRRHKPGSTPILPHCGPTGKVRLSSAVEATRAIEAIHAKALARGREPKPLRAYKCNRCAGGWHLSSKAAA